MTRARVLGTVAVVALYALPWVLDTVRLRMVIEVLYFGLFAVSFNLLFGYAGLLSFGHAATFGVGGYTLGLLLKYQPALPFLLALGLAALVGGAAGLIIGLFCVRLRGTYFALLTLAFSQFLFAVAFKWRAVTRGDDGLIVSPGSIAVPGLVTLELGQPRHFFLLEASIVLLCLWAAWRFTRTPLGTAAVYIVFQDWLSKTTENWHFFLGLAFVLMILYAHDGLIGLFAKGGPARRLLSRRGPGVEETA